MCNPRFNNRRIASRGVLPLLMHLPRAKIPVVENEFCGKKNDGCSTVGNPVGKVNLASCHVSPTPLHDDTDDKGELINVPDKGTPPTAVSPVGNFPASATNPNAEFGVKG